MKLLITGATGLVGNKLVKMALETRDDYPLFDYA